MPFVQINKEQPHRWRTISNVVNYYPYCIAQAVNTTLLDSCGKRDGTRVEPINNMLHPNAVTWLDDKRLFLRARESLGKMKNEASLMLSSREAW
jgi:hypothetical protein